MTESEVVEIEWCKRKKFWTSIGSIAFRLALPLILVGIGIGSLIGYAVPDLLCDDFKDRSANQRLSECIFADRDDVEDTSVRIAIAAIWSVLNLGWCCLPHLSIKLIQPSTKMSKRSFVSITIAGMSAVGITVCWIYILKRRMDSLPFVAILTFIMGMSSLTSKISSSNASKTSGNWIFWSTAWTVGYLAVCLEMFAMYRSLTVDVSLKELFLLRFVIHSILWWLTDTILRQSIRQCGTHKSLIEMQPLIPVKLCRSVYGWFLLFHSRNAFGYVHALIGCLALHQVISTITHKSKDLWLLKILHGKRAAEAIISSRSEMQLDTADRVADHLADCLGIAISGSLLFLANPQGISTNAFDGPSLQFTILSASLITVFTHCLLFQLSHHLHQSDLSPLLTSIPVTSVLFSISLIVLLVGSDLCLRTLSVSCGGRLCHTDPLM